MKKIITSFLGPNIALTLANSKNMIVNFFIDMKLFCKYSTVFSINHFENIEAKIILDYHAVEKGLLFSETKPRFAQKRITNLHVYLKDDRIIGASNLSQIKVAYQVMCEYFELHKKLKIDISDYFSIEQYDFYKSILNKNYSKVFNGAIEYEREGFYDNKSLDFEKFSWSRKSVRNFTGEKISLPLLEKAIQLASNAPSVCNRQASKVYLLEDKNQINNVLKIQGGFNGYTENVNQLLIITTDRKYFYTVGERNQFYIDGGIFLMNLLYSLHYYEIANCPANWGKTIKDERKLEEFITIPESEKIICMVPIGIAEQNFRVTLSKRRETAEIFKIID